MKKSSLPGGAGVAGGAVVACTEKVKYEYFRSFFYQGNLGS